MGARICVGCMYMFVLRTGISGVGRGGEMRVRLGFSTFNLVHALSCGRKMGGKGGGGGGGGMGCFGGLR